MFFPINRAADGAVNVFNLKSPLIRALDVASQIQRESAEMTEAQIQAHYGFDGTQTQWNATINGVVTALGATAVQNFISQLG